MQRYSISACYASISAYNASINACNASISACNASISACNASISACNASISACNASISACNVRPGRHVVIIDILQLFIWYWKRMHAWQFCIHAWQFCMHAGKFCMHSCMHGSQFRMYAYMAVLHACMHGSFSIMQLEKYINYWHRRHLSLKSGAQIIDPTIRLDLPSFCHSLPPDNSMISYTARHTDSIRHFARFHVYRQIYFLHESWSPILI